MCGYPPDAKFAIEIHMKKHHALGISYIINVNIVVPPPDEKCVFNIHMNKYHSHKMSYIMIVTLVSTPLTWEVGIKIHMKKPHGHALFHIMNVNLVDNQLNYFYITDTYEEAPWPPSVIHYVCDSLEWIRFDMIATVGMCALPGKPDEPAVMPQVYDACGWEDWAEKW